MLDGYSRRHRVKELTVRWSKRIATLAVVAAVAGGAGAALAHTPTPTGARPPVDPAVACERAGNLLTLWQARADRLTGRIAALQERIANADLPPRRHARAEARLRRLKHRLDVLEKRIERLQERIAEHCTDTQTT
jgi:hypothetical protein